MPKLSKEEASARYKEAKRYIQIKKFDEARKLLATIDHPKARELMDSLPAPKRRRPLAVRLLLALVVVVLVGVVVILGITLRNNAQRDAQEALRARTFSYCLADFNADLDQCSPWSRNVVIAQREPIARCSEAHVVDERFYECLWDAGVRPPR